MLNRYFAPELSFNWIAGIFVIIRFGNVILAKYAEDLFAFKQSISTGTAAFRKYVMK